MKFIQRHPGLATEVRELDLSQPVPPEDFSELQAVWLRSPLLVFPGQDITDAQQIAFARHFGDLEIHPSVEHRSTLHPEIYRVSNVRESGELMQAASTEWKYMELTWLWHSDSSFRTVPSKASILHGIEVTSGGGDTLFCDLSAVWSSLPGQQRAHLRTLEVLHSHDQVLAHSQGLAEQNKQNYVELPPVAQPLVRRHPQTGRESLFISPHTMDRVVGWSPEASQRLFEELIDAATEQTNGGEDSAFVYRHQWTTHDVILWDNRCTMHAVTPFESAAVRRIMHRVTVAGDEAVIPAPALPPKGQARGI